jgi:putative transposase
MNRDQLKRLKELETENQRLRRAVSDLKLDKMILAEAARDEGRPGNHPVDDFRTPQPF